MPRRPMSKSAKIRRALSRNLSPAYIAERYQTSLSTVYNIKSQMKRKAAQEQPTTIIASPEPTAPMVVAPLTTAPVAVPAGGIITLSDPTPVPPGGITYVAPTATPTAVVEERPSLWARFKLWMFGVK